ncbi:MAG: alpha/beta hydrolase [Gammaproteobacteria bacterium]|nr:alpha/beta hydrolase [Gammaproteobacteria bacterium]
MIYRRTFLGLVFLLLTSGCSLFTPTFDTEEAVFTDEVEPLQGQLFLPRDIEQPVAAVVVVHGGGWVRRSGDMVSISKQLARQGIAAFNITYRSAIYHPYPAAVSDVRRAIEWLRDNAERYRIDPQRIGGWGYSAGGQLILRAGLDPEFGLKAIVSGGTPAKFSYWPESPIITQFIGQAYAQSPERWEDASPVNHVQAASPAVFLYHGSEDTLVDPVQMDFMAEALAQKGVTHETHLAENRGHFGVYLFSKESEQKAIDFLKRQL